MNATSGWFAKPVIVFLAEGKTSHAVSAMVCVKMSLFATRISACSAACPEILVAVKGLPVLARKRAMPGWNVVAQSVLIAVQGEGSLVRTGRIATNGTCLITAHACLVAAIISHVARWTRTISVKPRNWNAGSVFAQKND